MRSTLLVLASLAIGCGSKIDAPSETTTTDTGATTTDGVATEVAVDDAAAEASADTGGVKPTEDRTCKRLVDAYCSKATQDCCGELGIPFAEAACRNAAMTYCSQLIDQVTLGRMTYDDSQLEACAKSWEAPSASCRSEFIPYLANSVACAQLFNGQREPGSECTYAYQCHAPPGAVVYCDETAKRCRASSVVPEGSTCNFSGSSLKFCQDGYYCDLTGSMAACKKELAAGAACSSANYIACGYSSTCVDGKCGAGLGAGEACTDGGQCSSWTCREGKCTTTLYNRVDKGLCNGGTSG
jgi:hypothetical protein